MVSIDGYDGQLHESQPSFPRAIYDSAGNYAGTIYRGPTPIKGENGQLELLLRTLRNQRALEQAASTIVAQQVKPV